MSSGARRIIGNDASGGIHTLAEGPVRAGTRLDIAKSQFDPRAALTDIFAGAICSILSIAYCLSYAALIFSGPLGHFLSYGIAVTFLSAAVAGTVVALRSSLFFAVAGPDSSTSVIIAAMVATLVRRMAASGQGDLLQATIVVVALATAVTG